MKILSAGTGTLACSVSGTELELGKMVPHMSAALENLWLWSMLKLCQLAKLPVLGFCATILFDQISEKDSCGLLALV